MLRHPPVTTQTRIEVKTKMSYPAVTFCYKNGDEQGFDLKILEVIFFMLSDRDKMGSEIIYSISLNGMRGIRVSSKNPANVLIL